MSLFSLKDKREQQLRKEIEIVCRKPKGDQPNDQTFYRLAEIFKKITRHIADPCRATFTSFPKRKMSGCFCEGETCFTSNTQFKQKLEELGKFKAMESTRKVNLMKDFTYKMTNQKPKCVETYLLKLFDIDPVQIHEKQGALIINNSWAGSKGFCRKRLSQTFWC